MAKVLRFGGERGGEAFFEAEARRFQGMFDLAEGQLMGDGNADLFRGNELVRMALKGVKQEAVRLLVEQKKNDGMDGSEIDAIEKAFLQAVETHGNSVLGEDHIQQYMPYVRREYDKALLQSHEK